MDAIEESLTNLGVYTVPVLLTREVQSLNFNERGKKRKLQ